MTTVPIWSLSPKVAPALSDFITSAVTTNAASTTAAHAYPIRLIRCGRAVTTVAVMVVTAGRRGCR